MRKIKHMVIVFLIVTVAGMLFCMPAAASDEAQGGGKQWIFLLPDADEEGAYMMFAKPALVGMTADEDTSVRAALHFTDDALELDKSYEVLLLPVKGNGQWLASETLALADRALKIDGQVELDLYKGESAEAHFEMALSDLMADWPEMKNSPLKLERAKNGELKQREFDITQWIKPSEDPLFTYTAEDEEGCEISYSSGVLTVMQAENGGHFAIAVSDPAGNRRTVMVELTSIKEAISPVMIIIPVIIAAAVILIIVLRKIRSSGKENALRNLQKQISGVQMEADNIILNAQNAWQTFENAKTDAEKRAREGDPECTMTLPEIRAVAAEVGRLKDINAYVNLNSANEKLLKLKDIVMYRLGGNPVRNPDEKALLDEYLDESSAAVSFDNIATNISNLKAITEEVSQRTQTLKMTAVPFEYTVNFHVTPAGGQPWNGMITKGTKMCHLDQYYLVRPRQHMELSAILQKITGLQAFSLDQNMYRVRVSQDMTLAMPGQQPGNYADIAYTGSAELTLSENGSLLCTLTFDRSR